MLCYLDLFYPTTFSAGPPAQGGSGAAAERQRRALPGEGHRDAQ